MRSTVARTPRGRKRKLFDLPFRGIRKYQRGTKRERLIRLLVDGGTLEQAMEITQRNYRNTYRAIEALHSYVGFGIREDAESGIIKLVISEKDCDWHERHDG